LLEARISRIYDISRRIGVLAALRELEGRAFRRIQYVGRHLSLLCFFRVSALSASSSRGLIRAGRAGGHFAPRKMIDLNHSALFPLLLHGLQPVILVVAELPTFQIFINH
jgi:hypothetical protein